MENAQRYNSWKLYTDDIEGMSNLMSKLINLTGKRFERLLVISRGPNAKNKQTTWECVCDCGNTCRVRSDHLRSKATRSCGCLERENRNDGAHVTHGKSNTRIYKIYSGMKKRCYNKNCHAYANYGGRGISICKIWLNDFNSFYLWALANGYDDSLSIDRIDVNGNYEPSNCRWTDAKEQANNRRKRKLEV